MIILRFGGQFSGGINSYRKLAYNNLDAGNYIWEIGMNLSGHSTAVAQQIERIYEAV